MINPIQTSHFLDHFIISEIILSYSLAPINIQSLAPTKLKIKTSHSVSFQGIVYILQGLFLAKERILKSGRNLVL